MSWPRISRAALSLLEDLGSDPVANDDGPVFERYAEAVGVLAALHAAAHVHPSFRGLPAIIRFPAYDIEALSIEIELLLDWYVPHIARATPASGVRSDFSDLWRDLFAGIVASKPRLGRCAIIIRRT